MKGETLSMQVYLLRHGVAEDDRPGLSDADRALTPEGKQKLREVLRVAATAEVLPTLMISSPLKRALETASIAKEILGAKTDIVRSKALTPGSPVDQAWDEIRAHKDEGQILLVGHEPLFGYLTAFLLGTPSLKIDFKKGAILRIDFENFPPQPHGLLRWYLTAKLCVDRSRPRTRKAS